MALVLKDRVKETSTTTGTGSFNLAGAVDGFQSFSAIGNGNKTYYSVTDDSSWEVGIGTYTASGTVLSRDTILSSSNSGSKVSFPSGVKVIICTQPADKANYLDESGYITGLDAETHIDLNTTVANKPSHSEGRLFYDKAFGALAFYNEESEITLQLGQEDYIRVLNNTGSTVLNGTPVYLTGEVGATPTIAPAVANDTYIKSQVVGIATHEIENNSTGYVTVRGLIGDVDTGHLTAGSAVHLAPTGGTQVDSPTYPNFPTELGICLIASSSGGCIYVHPIQQSFENVRITENSHFDANVTVGGDLTVLGTQTIANSQNIAISGSMQYLNAGDTIGDANTAFAGTGLDDGVFTGHYNGTASKTFKVRIDGTHGGDSTFEWSIDNFNTTEATDVAVDGTDQALSDGISIKFNASSGHDLGDVWTGTAAPTNVDSGTFSNRNTGTTGVGYTHMGWYFDVSTQKFTFLQEYDPEPAGIIDLTDASATLATIKAATFEGALSGNATTASALETARTIQLSGDVTGSVSFSGGAAVNMTTTVANDSHTHSIYVPKAGGTMTGTLGVPTVDLGDWTIFENSGSLYFAYQGTKKFKLDNTGSLSTTNDVQTDETLS
jgi:hypothetical protein